MAIALATGGCHSAVPTAGMPVTTSAGAATNHLASEKSPYLLQHQHNPVDWYPWGEEAFKKAKAEDKPVFLSIGYSTCHWCHVMAHESFEDADVARYLNDHFVSIKVDREERPDIDAIYMAVCQAMIGSGGWPLSVFMAPDQKPFFAGTYFPKTDRGGRPGMLTILREVVRLWTTERTKVESRAEQVAAALRANGQKPRESQTIPLEILRQGFVQLRGQFDSQHGGFGTAPKFPTPHHLTSLLRWDASQNVPEAVEIVEKTLDAMRLGGLYDHVGFGFHRYSTDGRWFLPHFEKMLYDQAQLVFTYLEAYQATGHERHATVAREVLTYVLRDMTAPDGGFYSAEDADSEGVEGKFYLWTNDEVASILGADEGKLVGDVFNMEEGGNVHDEATGHAVNGNHWYLRSPIDVVAKQIKMAPEALTHQLEQARQKLLAVRERRVRPQKDDKILTDWNGLMIAAMARAGWVLGDPAYVSTARRAADFILATLKRADGRLWHRFRAGDVAVTGMLDDYAFLIWGLIEVYQATFDPTYLNAALGLSEETIRRFWDDRTWSFFQTADDHETLIVRTREFYDGALPSGNSVMAWNMQRLARLSGRVALSEKADALIHTFLAVAERSPSAFTQFLVALDFWLGPVSEVVIAGDPESPDTRAMLAAVRERFLPRVVVHLHPTGEKGKAIEALTTYVKPLVPQGGKATAYVCKDFSCQAPTTDVGEFMATLDR